jgi:hypothetical protein
MSPDQSFILHIVIVTQFFVWIGAVIRTVDLSEGDACSDFQHETTGAGLKLGLHLKPAESTFVIVFGIKIWNHRLPDAA